MLASTIWHVYDHAVDESTGASKMIIDGYPGFHNGGQHLRVVINLQDVIPLLLLPAPRGSWIERRQKTVISGSSR